MCHDLHYLGIFTKSYKCSNNLKRYKQRPYKSSSVHLSICFTVLQRIIPNRNRKKPLLTFLLSDSYLVATLNKTMHAQQFNHAKPIYIYIYEVDEGTIVLLLQLGKVN